MTHLDHVLDDEEGSYRRRWELVSRGRFVIFNIIYIYIYITYIDTPAAAVGARVERSVVCINKYNINMIYIYVIQI